MKCAFYPAIFGFLAVGYDADAIVSLRFTKEIGGAHEPTPMTDQVKGEIEEYLAGTRRMFTFPYHFSGSDFQNRVWQFLLSIPYGETRSYKEVAEAIGCPKGARAVGRAVHENPLWIVVPCHRIIGSRGEMTGYAGGTAMKEQLLQTEKKVFLT